MLNILKFQEVVDFVSNEMNKGIKSMGFTKYSLVLS